MGFARQKRKRQLNVWFDLTTQRERKKVRAICENYPATFEIDFAKPRTPPNHHVESKQNNDSIKQTNEEKEQQLEKDQQLEKEQQLEQINKMRDEEKEASKYEKEERKFEKDLQYVEDELIQVRYLTEREKQKISIIIILNRSSFTVIYPLVIEQLKIRSKKEQGIEGNGMTETHIHLKEDAATYPQAFFEFMYDQKSLEFLTRIQEGSIPDEMDLDPDAVKYYKGTILCSVVDNRLKTPLQHVSLLLPTEKTIQRGIEEFIMTQYGPLRTEERLQIESNLINSIYRLKKNHLLETYQTTTNLQQKTIAPPSNCFRRMKDTKILLTLDGNASIHNSMVKTVYGKPHCLKPYLTDKTWDTQLPEYEPVGERKDIDFKIKTQDYHSTPIQYFQKYKDTLITKVADMVKEYECSNLEKKIKYYIYVTQTNSTSSRSKNVVCFWYMFSETTSSFRVDHVESSGTESFCERLTDVLLTDKYKIDRQGCISKEQYALRRKKLDGILKHQHLNSTTKKLHKLLNANPVIKKRYQDIMNDQKLTSEEKEKQTKALIEKLAKVAQAK